jgi:hypothetical protein
VGGIGSAFNRPQGVGVDDTTGVVYVQDANNNRIQKFTATGEFVLTWGKEVNATTGGNVCTAASGNTCKPGATTGDPNTTPPTPSANGQFSGWSQANGPGLGVDDAGFVYVVDPRAVPFARVQKFDPNGTFVSQIAASNVNFFDRGLNFPNALAIDGDGDTYVTDEQRVKLFEASDYTPSGLTAAWDRTYGEVGSVFGGVRQVAVDPATGFIFVGEQDEEVGCPGTGPGYPIQEFHPSGEEVDCTVPTSPALTNNQIEAGMAVSEAHKIYIGQRTADAVRVYAVPVAEPPVLEEATATEVTSKSARLKAPVSARLSDTTYHIEYGPEPCSSNPCASSPESASIGAAITPKVVDHRLEGLTPDTTYFFRFVVTNGEGTDEGSDRVFATFASPTVDNSCENNLARQQTGSAFLLDCRAYELVSAEDTGGYNVVSDLVPGQTPFAGYPKAADQVLYSIHNGGVPNTGKPTNRGPDPYVATRNKEARRWETEYVGIPADVPSKEPFSSTVAGADATLDTFAFGGPDICDPCFGDESAGMPVRTPDGELVQGMIGSMPVPAPEPAGEVRKHVSGDGTHFVFGSTQRFEPEGNESGTDVTIYDRNLETGTTQVVSTLPNGDTIAAGQDVAALDISEDGSRVLIGEIVGTDTEGNRHYDLYMHVGSTPESVLVADTPNGVLYKGMTSDASKVYFTTSDVLAGDGDTSADLFRADVGNLAATVTRVSTGTGGSGDTDSCDPAGNSFNSADWNVVPGGPTDCSVVAIGGGGGVAAENGTIYFLSPEKLDGSGVAGAPNLFRAQPGGDPEFVTTLESSANEPLQPASHVLSHSFGSFVNPEGAAIDPVDGSTYILDTALTVQTPGAYVQKFDAGGQVDTTFGNGGKVDGKAEGEPFLAFGNGALGGLPVGVPIGIAVDAAPGSPNYRDLWVPDLSSGVFRFSPSGAYEAEISAVEFPQSVAVNPASGNVTIAGLFGEVKTFAPNGAEVGPSIAIPFFSPVDVAVDSAGNTYIADGSTTAVYDSTGAFVETLDASTKFGVTVDPSDDHVYVDRGDRVIEYDDEGNQVGEPIGLGVLSESISLAADSGRLSITNKGSGKAAAFTAPITPPSRGYDSPLVIAAVREGEMRRTSHFQTNPSGDVSAFPSVLSLTGFDNAGRYELFRYDAEADAIDCVSCNPTLATPLTDATLASNGLSVSDDGRVFFTTGEPLVLRDGNSKLDAYEWSDGTVELISTGKDRFDSGLLSVSADGVDAFFFSRETLAPNDRNGNRMKIYDARSEGGFFVIPPPPPCAASDECHGPGSQAAPPIDLGTLEGEGRNPAPEATCDPAQLSNRARALERRAAQLRRKARGHSGKAAARLRRNARKNARKAKRARNAAKRCLRQSGGAK